ncbi:MAG TPA: hypothetical protein VHY20_04825, partial [Pirellulales bacterium]|nr:hypothetical protein [Pirellulales bacterium]
MSTVSQCRRRRRALHRLFVSLMLVGLFFLVDCCVYRLGQLEERMRLIERQGVVANHLVETRVDHQPTLRGRGPLRAATRAAVGPGYVLRRPGPRTTVRVPGQRTSPRPRRFFSVLPSLRPSRPSVFPSHLVSEFRHD